MKKRAKHLFFVIAILFVVFIGYYFLYKFYPSLALKCVFYEVTGLKCPGCGITRMLSSFISFDFYGGIKYNWFLGLTIPVVILIIGYSCYLYLTCKKGGKGFNAFCLIYLVLLVIWAIVRNIVGI